MLLKIKLLKIRDKINMESLHNILVSFVIWLNTMLPLIKANIIPFALLLGVVVFFHELGHFLVAKLFGVRVDEFSLGFPPKIIGKKFGETEYIISLLPIGGYVKLAGQDDFGTQEINKLDKGMYYSKPAWQRLLIVFAGPFMNFIIGWTVFTYVFNSGVNVDYDPAHPGKIGYVFENSAAQEAGVFSGDEILKIGEKKIESWNDLLELSMNPQADNYEALILRGNKTLKKEITPKKSGNRYVFGILQYQPPVVGTIFESQSDTSNISVLRANDEIIALDNQPTPQWLSIDEYIFFRPNVKITAYYKRDGYHCTDIIIPRIQTIKDAGFLAIDFKKDTASLFYTMTNIVEKTNDSRLADFFKNGDKIVEVSVMKPVKNKIKTIEIYDYEKVNSFKPHSGFEIVRNLTGMSNKYVEITIQRGDQLLKKIVQVLSKDLHYGEINITPKEYVEYYSVIDSFKRSLRKTKDLIIQTFQVIGKIFMREMEARDALGGPITIWKITVISAEAGYKHFLLLLAIISINLGFINLLPIPVIDGGHIVIYLYEIISGKMPSEKALNIIQQIGLAFILFLMIFTFYIDISKMF